RARLDQMVVRSGIDGLVLKRDVQPGDLAAPSRMLLQIGNVRDLWITATVDERDIPRLAVGQQALLKSDAWPGKVIRGRLVELTPGGDPDQRAFRVRIAPDAGAALPIGLTFEVNITVREAQRAVLVPGAAVRDGAVWKVVGGRATRQPIETGIAGADMIEVRAGLSPGDVVIVNPPADLQSGAKVLVAARGGTR
ncbi:MAG TPA: efflux RND transporter periplasmic adaptor subunit, partial [Sphingomonas sp.]